MLGYSRAAVGIQVLQPLRLTAEQSPPSPTPNKEDQLRVAGQCQIGTGAQDVANAFLSYPLGAPTPVGGGSCLVQQAEGQDEAQNQKREQRSGSRLRAQPSDP